MRPIRLEFQGLKSYTERTVIDFQKLTREGIFGIFGNTGSGKSTVLDSMLLALYGRLPKTTTASDFINYNLSECSVEFAFTIKDGNVDKQYCVSREFKLKSERRTGSHKALFCEISNGIKTPIAEGADKVTEKTEEVIGLKMDDFEKCIILPQGEFASFVTLQKSKRLLMMSSLFNLDKYGDGLRKKVKKKLGDLDVEIKSKEMLLTAYETDTKDDLEKTKTQIEDNENAKTTLDIKFSKIKEEKRKNEINYETHNKLKKLNIRLENLEKLKPSMEIKKRSLDKFDLVKNAKEMFLKIDKIKHNIESENKILQGYIEEQVELEKELDKLSVRKNNLQKSDSELSHVETALIALEGIKEDISDKITIETKIAELRIKHKGQNAEIEQLKISLDKIEIELEKLNKELEDKKVKENISQVLTEIEKSTNDEFLISELEFLKSLKPLTEDSAKELVCKRIDFINNRLSSGEAFDLRSLLDKLSSLYEESDKYHKQIQGLENKKLELSAKYSTLTAKNSAVIEEGQNLRTQFDKLQARIDKILSGKNYEIYKAELSARKNELLSENENVKKLSEILNERKTDLFTKISASEANLSQYQLSLEETEKEYKDIVEKEFENEAEIQKIAVLIGDNASLLKTETESFFNELYSIQTQIEDCKKIIDDNGFSEERYKEICQNYEKVEENIKNIDNILYNLYKTYEKQSLNFEKRCIIEKQISELKKEYSLNDKLSKALSYNGLLEFVSDEYLKEIAQIAKITLLTLTDGRFGLRYDGDFMVEDNVLGGQIRKVDTVSGGELFLVSLSLALALSKSIYSKSQKPIEFFFLDEGFGSLDKDLVETVMDCLNKLKDEHLIIGVISHVEGLKERINAKILVSPASETGGSTLSVI